jgi:hypothetical protein
VNQIWPWALSVASLLGLWITGNKMRVGWLVSLASEGLWFTYALVSRQYGFISMSVVFSAVHIRNWLKWKPEKER